MLRGQDDVASIVAVLPPLENSWPNACNHLGTLAIDVGSKEVANICTSYVKIANFCPNLKKMKILAPFVIRRAIVCGVMGKFKSQNESRFTRMCSFP